MKRAGIGFYRGGHKKADLDLERKVRNIIKNEYGFGDQIIESKDIYGKLTGAGEDVPELALDDIFYKLEQDGLIRGMSRLNGDAIRRHGAYKITWVSRYI